MPSDKRRDVEQQHVLRGFGAAGKNIGLHCRAQGDNFVRIQVGVRLAMEHLFHQSAHFGNSRRAADQHHFINLLGLQAGIFQGLFARADGAIDDGLNQLLELFPRDLSLIVLAAWQFNFERGRRLGRKRNLGLDDGLANGGYSFAIPRNIDAHVAANVVERDRDQEIVNVIAAQMRIAVGGDDLEDSVVQL